LFEKQIFIGILVFDFEPFIGVQNIFIAYNNHKMFFNRWLWMYKANADLKDYNYLYN